MIKVHCPIIRITRLPELAAISLQADPLKATDIWSLLYRLDLLLALV